MPRLRCIIPGLLVALLLFMAVSPVGAEALQPIGVAGGERVLWAFRGQVGPDDRDLVSFAFRGVDDPIKRRFFPQVIGPVGGRVVQACVRGVNLHVFYADGTHRRCAPGRPPWVLHARPRQLREVSLHPAAPVVPIAVAADESSDAVVALVTTRQAADLATFAALREPPAEPSAPDAQEPAAIEPPPLPPADLALVHYHRGAWSLNRPGPPDLRLEGTVLAIVARGGVVHLVYRAADSTNWLHRRSDGADAEWNDAAVVSIVDEPIASAGGWALDGPVLLVAEALDEGVKVCAQLLGDEGAKNDVVITGDDGHPARFAPPLALAVYDGKAVIATAGADGLVEAGLWSLSDGAPIEASAEIAPLVRPVGVVNEPTPLSHILLQCAVLGAVLASVFAWRRDSVTIPAQPAPGFVLARLWRRAVAFLIDSVIVAPLSLAAFATMLDEGALTLTRTEPTTVGLGNSPELFWAGAAAGVVFGLYACLFEAILRTTPGKRLTRLSVSGEDGKRCSVRAVVVRNAIRVVELLFPPLLLLAVVTINRQRLGDLFARTIVVEPSAAGPEPSDSDAPHHDDQP